MSKEKIADLVSKAKDYLAKPNAERTEDCWRAYVCIEYAILDLKLANQLVVPTQRVKKKRMGQQERLALARGKLESLKLNREPLELLQELRDCRDILKALVANYDKGPQGAPSTRRSTTS
jgi:hypothetical protein